MNVQEIPQKYISRELADSLIQKSSLDERGMCIKLEGIYHDDNECSGAFIITEKQKGEESGYGTVWETCCESSGSCDFVAKYQKSRAEKEVNNQVIAARHGLAPKIQEYWECDDGNGSFIIMSELEDSAKTVLKETNDPSVIGELYHLLVRLHDIGMVHGDPHLGNFMNSSGQFLLIDFGESYFANKNTDQGYLGMQRDFIQLRGSILYNIKKYGLSENIKKSVEFRQLNDMITVEVIEDLYQSKEKDFKSKSEKKSKKNIQKPLPEVREEMIGRLVYFFKDEYEIYGESELEKEVEVQFNMLKNINKNNRYKLIKFKDIYPEVHNRLQSL